MRVRLLGTVDVQVGDEVRAVPGLRRQAILSVLALNAGQAVSAGRLIDLVWGDQAPSTGLNTVQSHVSYLRRLLGSRAAIVSRPPGYLLDTPGDASDAVIAERLIHAGLRAADPAGAAEPLRQALALWRGTPLQGVTEVPWLAEQAERLSNLEFEARRALAEARLALGEHAELVPELQALAAQHPFDEQIQAQLVLALYRTGRQSDALAVVREVRRLLVTELGIDVGPHLRELESAVLQHDVAPVPVRERAEVRPAGQDGPALVGRTRELLTLLRHLDREQPAGPVMPVVTGDPGMGKTRLLSELSGRAAQSGWTVLWGRAAEFEQQVPFAVVMDALADHLTRAEPRRLGTVADTDRALLREILPMLPAPAEQVDARRTVEAERYLLYRAFRCLLEALAPPSGLLLILEDLHWADQSSAELLAYLLRNPPRGPVVVALSYRPRQLRGRITQGLGRAMQDGTANLVELSPLSAAEAAALLPVEFGDDHRRQLYEAAGGNPLYLLALARVSRPGPAFPSSGAGEWDEVPGAVREALQGELDALSEPETVVARAAAVVGDPAEPALIAETAELPEAEVRRVLDALAGHDLLRPVARTGRFQFRHPLIRRIAYDLAGSGWRVAAHGRAAAALARKGAPAPEQAHHLESSAQRGDLAAVEVLQRAATEILHSSPGTAAHWLGTALRLIPGDQPDAALFLLGMQAQSLALSGQLVESREVLHRLRQSLPAEVTPFRAQLAGSCAGIERMLGRHREANALLRAELARVTDPEGAAAATLMLALGSEHTQPVTPGAPDWLGRALAAARRAGTPGTVADTLVHMVFDEQAAGTWDATTAARLDEAVALVDAMPDGELLQSLHLAAWLATAEAVYERLNDATRHIERALRLARAAGQMYIMHGIHLLFVGIHMARGDLAAASRSLGDAREATTLAGTDTMMSLVLTRECTLATLAGDAKLARRAGAEAVALAGRREDYTAGVAVQMLATAHLHAGDPAACTAMLAGKEEFRSSPTFRATLYETLALAWSEQGRPDTAATWAGRAEAEVAVWSTPRRAGLAALARSHALRSADATASAAHAATAARLFTGAGDSLLAGRAHLHAAAALAADGRTTRARRELDQARTLFASCGAALFTDQADQAEQRLLA